MPLNSTIKSSRFLQSRRYTHDTLLDGQESFTKVLDLSAAEIYTDQALIPTSSLPYSGSGQSGLTYNNTIKYWYRQKMTPSNVNREVWFFTIPTGSITGIGPQLIDVGQQTNFISPKYSIASLATNTTEDATPGYAVKVFVSTGSVSGFPLDTEVIQSTLYAFDYKDGVLEFSQSAAAPASSASVYVSIYQYIGNTLDTKLVTGQLTASNGISGTITSASYASLASTASFALNAGSSGTTLATGSLVPITASWAQTASVSNSSSYASTSGQTITSSYALTSSFVNGFPFDRITTTIPVTASNVILFQRPTSSFNTAFFDYSVGSGSNQRAGIMFGTWNDTTIFFTEQTTIDIGDTSQVSMSMTLNAGFVQFVGVSQTTPNWNVKSFIRYL